MEAEPTIENFFEEPLPPQEDPRVAAALAQRQEFAALASGPTEEQPLPGHYYKHQRFVVEFLKRYDRLLLLHDAGTGKTCSIGATAEYYKDLFVLLRELPQQLFLAQMPIKRAYILVRGGKMAEQFGAEIANVCRPGVYITERELLDFNESGRKHHITKELKKWYEIVTVRTFYNRHFQDSDEQLAEDFSGCFFYVDEIHNWTFRPTAKMEPPDSPRWAAQRAEARGEESKGPRPQPELRAKDKLNIYHFFWRLFHLVDRSKIVVGSATPMSNVPEEIVPIINLITPLDLTLPYQIPPEGILGDERYARLFDRAVTGRVSFFRALFTGAVPFYTGEPIALAEEDGHTFTRVRLVTMSENQTRVYNRVVIDSREGARAVVDEVAERESETASQASAGGARGRVDSLYLRQRQASAFVYPPASRALPTPEALRAQVVEGPKYDEQWMRPLLVGGAQPHAYLQQPTQKMIDVVERDPAVCSAKFAAIFDDIERAPNQLRFIYGEWVVGPGVVALGAYLMARGAMPVYLQSGQKSFFVAPPSQLSQRLTGQRFPRAKQKELTGFAKLLYSGRNLRGEPVKFYFAVVTSGTSDAERDAIFQLFSWSQNWREGGRYILVLIGSQQLGEGINLKNVLHMDVVNPTFDSREIYQAVRRVLRVTSHGAIIEQRMLLALEAVGLLGGDRLDDFLTRHGFEENTGLSRQEIVAKLSEAARLGEDSRRRVLQPLAFVRVDIGLYGATPDGRVVEREVGAMLRERAEAHHIVERLGLNFLIDGMTSEEIVGLLRGARTPEEAAAVAKQLGDAAQSSAVDIAIYVRAEAKDRRLHEILRRLKELAVDCAVNYENNVRPADVPGSPECDFAECEYNCGAALTGVVPTSLSSPELEAAVEAFVRAELGHSSAITVGEVRRAFGELAGGASAGPRGAGGFTQLQVMTALAAFLAREPAQKSKLGLGRQIFLEDSLIYLAAERGSSLDRLYSEESFLTRSAPLADLLAEAREVVPIEDFLANRELLPLRRELMRVSNIPLMPQRLLIPLFERVAAEYWATRREYPITGPLMRALRWMYSTINAPQGRPRSRAHKSERPPKVHLPKKPIAFDRAKPVVYVHFLGVLENESFSRLHANYTTVSDFKNANTPGGLRVFDPSQIDWGEAQPGSPAYVAALLGGWRTAPPDDDRYVKALLGDTHRRYLDALSALETYGVYVPQFDQLLPKFLLANRLNAKMQKTERAFGKVCKPREAASEVVRIFVHLHRLATLPVAAIGALVPSFKARLAALQAADPARYRQLWHPVPPEEAERRRRIVRSWEEPAPLSGEAGEPGAPSAAEAIQNLGYFAPPPGFDLTPPERARIVERFLQLPPGSPLRDLALIAPSPGADYDLAVAAELFDNINNFDFCALVQDVFGKMGLIFAIIDWPSNE
jgi:hypothetical protein